MVSKNLTSEELKKKFSDNFGMTNFAIAVARSYVDEHQDGSLKKILAEVSKQAEKQNV